MEIRSGQMAGTFFISHADKGDLFCVGPVLPVAGDPADHRAMNRNRIGWSFLIRPYRLSKEEDYTDLPDYGTQKGWMRVNAPASTEDGFEPVPEQLKLPFDEPE